MRVFDRLLRSLRSISVAVRIAMIAGVGVTGIIILGAATLSVRAIQEQSQAEMARFTRAEALVGGLKADLVQTHMHFFDFLRKRQEDRADRVIESIGRLRAAVDGMRAPSDAALPKQDIETLFASVSDLSRRISHVVTQFNELGIGRTEGANSDLDLATLALETTLQQQVARNLTPAIVGISNAIQRLMKLQARFMMHLDEPTETRILLEAARLREAVAKADIDEGTRTLIATRLNAQIGAFDAWAEKAKALSSEADRTDWTFAKASEPLQALHAALDSAALNHRQRTGATLARADAFYQGAVFLILLLGALVAVAVSASITRPLRNLLRSVERLTAGDTEVEIRGKHAKDEIGVLARAMLLFRDTVLERAAMSEREQAEFQARATRAIRHERAVAQFGESVSGVMLSLGAAAEGLAGASDRLRSVAGTTSQRTEAANEVAGAMANRVAMVAGATDELSASIAEIAQRTSESAAMADRAMNQVDATRARMSNLSSTALRIGEVVGLIQAIANQTNLLALNATIEAARAGEAGRGFAVVAQEVKSLANQTRAATEDIAAQVAAIQVETRGAADAVISMADVVDSLRSVALHVAASVQEQDATVSEIAANMGEINAGAEIGAGAARAAGQAAVEATEVSQDIGRISGELSATSAALAGNVDSFLRMVRSA